MLMSRKKHFTQVQSNVLQKVIGCCSIKKNKNKIAYENEPDGGRTHF